MSRIKKLMLHRSFTSSVRTINIKIMNSSICEGPYVYIDYNKRLYTYTTEFFLDLC